MKTIYLLLTTLFFLCNTNFQAEAQNECITLTWEVEAGVEKWINLEASSGKQLTVDWGDGTSVISLTGNGDTDIVRGLEHIYSTSGSYTVTIQGKEIDCLFTSLACYDSNLTELEVSKAPSLVRLECTLNFLESLQLEKNTALTSLKCSFNRLGSLNVKQNKGLTILSCSANNLTSLDLDQNTVLAELFCFGNKLTSLNLDRNVLLTNLNCSNNLLTSLVLNSKTELSFLNCSNNQISSNDMEQLMKRVKELSK